MAQATSQEQSQPKVGAQRPKPEHASPDAQDAAERSSLQPEGDVVAMVSRDVNGEPAQSANFAVLVDDDPDATDEEKAVAYNKAGEESGAKNFKGRKPRDYDAEAKDREKAADTERTELRKHNKHSWD